MNPAQTGAHGIILPSQMSVRNNNKKTHMHTAVLAWHELFAYAHKYTHTHKHTNVRTLSMLLCSAEGVRTLSAAAAAQHRPEKSVLLECVRACVALAVFSVQMLLRFMRIIIRCMQLVNGNWKKFVKTVAANVIVVRVFCAHKEIKHVPRNSMHKAETFIAFRAECSIASRVVTLGEMCVINSYLCGFWGAITKPTSQPCNTTEMESIMDHAKSQR